MTLISLTPERPRIRKAAANVRSCPGVITIYLSLTLVLTSALIFTLIESARVSAMNAKLRSVTYMAADSVFSEFAEPVFDDYGVMLLWSDEQEFLQKFDEHCRNNLSYDSVLGIYADIYRAQEDSSVLTQTKGPTDDGGQPFADQVLEYMEYYLAEDAADRILDSVSIFDQGDKVSAFMDKIESYGEVFTRVEESVANLKEKINNVKSIASDPSDYLSDASDAIDEFNNFGGGSHKFSAAMSGLKSSKQKLTKGLNQVRSATETYYENVEAAQAAVSDLETELAVSKDDFDSDVYGIVSEQVEDIRQKSADTDFDYYLVGANEDRTSSYIAKLDSLDNLLSETSDTLSEENADEYQTLIQRYSRSFQSFNLDSLDVNLNSSEVAKEDDGFLSDISDLFNSGILGFVAGDVSERSIETSDLPSVTENMSASSDDSTDLMSAGTDKALFGEYVLQHFKNFTSEEDTPVLDYETEYILSGKSTDKANLSAIVSQIVLLRTGCNLISILKSTAKKAETYALATSLAGFTGMPIVIKIFQILIVAAWALAESIVDVKALLEGHKIRTIKDDSDWYLSLAGIKNFGSDALSPAGNESGLSYESYLRLLLMMQNKNLQYFRTMDMIQANMCETENSEFRIKDTYVSLSVQAQFTAPGLFIYFPFVDKLISTTGGSYTYTILQNYSY